MPTHHLYTLTWVFMTLSMALPATYCYTHSIEKSAQLASSLPMHSHDPTSDTTIVMDEKEMMYTIEGISYFTPTHQLLDHPSTLPASPTSLDHLSPVTIIALKPDSHGMLTLNSITTAIDNSLNVDDVLTQSWLKNLILRVPKTDHLSKIEGDLVQILQIKYGVKHLYLESSIQYTAHSGLARGDSLDITTFDHSMLDTLNGPYLWSRGNGAPSFYPVYRLYSDIYRTFLFGMYPTDSRSGRYNSFRQIDEQGYSMIPVPSRLYTSDDEDNGIRGKRIGVKDLFDVNGVPTSAGSREFGELYGNRNETAGAIKSIIQAGGCLVGKTKTTAFATGLRDHDGSISEQYPFSPRSDLYQSCGTSSSGSACAIAAYDWLDFAIGTDMAGHLRGPAAVTGVYGNRPSTGATPLDGVISLSSYADTSGVLARDPSSFTSFIRTWYEQTPLKLRQYPRLPSILLVASDYLDNTPPAALQMIQGFIIEAGQKLSMHVEQIRVDDTLARYGLTGEALHKLDEDIVKGMNWWTYRHNGRLFHKEYANANAGRLPPVDPVLRHAWAKGKSLGDYSLEYRSLEERVTVFGEVFNQNILRWDEGSCSKSILVYDIGHAGRPRYREMDLNNANETRHKTFLQGKDLAPLAGCPDYTIPIGQIQWISEISGIEEMQTVAINIVAARGCDFVLAKFVDMLYEEGLISTVKTGRTPF